MRRILSGAMIAIVLLSLFAMPAVAARSTVWNVPGNFETIQAAIDSPNVAAGDTILVARGNHAGAYVTKSVQIKGRDGAVINSGPAHVSGQIMGFRLLAGSDGTKISNLKFEVALAIMNGAAVNDVVVEHCTFVNALQAISNWSGNRWTISHNDIKDLKTSNGGGIGILIGDRFGGVVEGNVVTHNDITGTLNVGGGIIGSDTEQGGYNGSGIVLYADFRYGFAGASAIKNNRITNNSVRMVSNNPALIDICAFEMTDSREDPTFHVIYDNTVMFNDFRGTELQIVLTPENLGDYNKISWNLGDNHGHEHNTHQTNGHNHHGSFH